MQDPQTSFAFGVVDVCESIANTTCCLSLGRRFVKALQTTHVIRSNLKPYHHHQHVPGLLQTSAIMAFQSYLSSVLLMSSLSGDSFLVTKLFRLSVYFLRCLPLLLVPQIFPLNICFSSPSALCICPENCSYLFLRCVCESIANRQTLSHLCWAPTNSPLVSFEQDL